MSYIVIDPKQYYRRNIFQHFTEDCKCSVSMTKRIDVTALKDYSERTGTKFYLNFLYLLCRALNSREDFRMAWDWRSEELRLYDKIHPMQYVFHEDTETFSVVYSEYFEDYAVFYEKALADLERGKQTREYGLDADDHPNWFDASYLPWISYDSLHLELPDGYLYFPPIINWGRHTEENGRRMMPLTVRLNHAAADGFLLTKVFLLVEEEIRKFCKN